ncbi:MAG TPA: thermonuclease family protein [Planctomycetota bacterium]|nr:thermonuclease family protein [Planctomycetota bacterium]
MPPAALLPSSFVRVARFALALFVAGALQAAPQESRPRAESRTYAWTLVPPGPTVPCPSRLDDAPPPPELLYGEMELAVDRPAVIDGDTLRLKNGESVRFVGLDAEETFKDAGKRALAEADWTEYVRAECAGALPTRPPKYGTPLGEAARDGLRKILDGAAAVRLEFDDPERRVDGFGRKLCLVSVATPAGRVDVNVEMVRQGLSPYFVKYGRSKRRHDAFVAAQNEARAARRGVWSTGSLPHYGDYDVRLRWWSERDEALAEAERLRRSDPVLFLLGRPGEWERLKGAAGRRVTVFGVAESRREIGGGRALLRFPHEKGRDFAVVGPKERVDALEALTKFAGDLVYVSGEVSLYKDAPQFTIEAERTVTLSRRPPTPTK